MHTKIHSCAGPLSLLLTDIWTAWVFKTKLSFLGCFWSTWDLHFSTRAPKRSQVWLLCWGCPESLTCHHRQFLMWTTMWQAQPLVREIHPLSVSQSCLTLCDPMDCSPPGSSVRGILQERILEWVTMPSSRGSSWPRDSNLCPLHCRQILYHLSHQATLPYHSC